MGVLYLGPFSGFRNRTGNLVGYRSRGLDIIRSYVVPKQSYTENSTLQRNKFSVAVAIASELNNFASFVSLWNSVKEVDQTYFSQFLKFNIKNCDTKKLSDPGSFFPQSSIYQNNLTLSNVSLSDFDVVATVPVLSNVFNRDLTDFTNATFSLVFCGTSPASSNLLSRSSIITKSVSSYNPSSTYSLTIALDNYSKTILTDYAVSQIQILLQLSSSTESVYASCPIQSV